MGMLSVLKHPHLGVKIKNKWMKRMRGKLGVDRMKMQQTVKRLAIVSGSFVWIYIRYY